MKSAEDVAYRSLNYGMRASWHTGTNAALARREEVEKLESVPFSADVLKYGLQSILLLFFLPVLLTSKRQSSWWKTFSADACCVLAATLLFARPVFQLFLDFLARPKAVELQRRVCSRWFDPRLLLSRFCPCCFSFLNPENAVKEAVPEVALEVEELGLHISGGILINDLLPSHEKNHQELVKRTEFSTISGESTFSVSHLGRFAWNMLPSFPLRIDSDQLCMRKPIQHPVATLQCINHHRSSISGPDLDSYLTLFKDASEEADQMDEKWMKEVDDWMTRTFGLRKEELNTGTRKQVRSHLQMLLRRHLDLPHDHDCLEIEVDLGALEGQKDSEFFVTVLFGREHSMKASQYPRASQPSRDQPIKVKVHFPAGVQQCKVLVWRRSKMAEELVGITENIDIRPMPQCFVLSLEAVLAAALAFSTRST